MRKTRRAATNGSQGRREQRCGGEARCRIRGRNGATQRRSTPGWREPCVSACLLVCVEGTTQRHPSRHCPPKLVTCLPLEFHTGGLEEKKGTGGGASRGAGGGVGGRRGWRRGWETGATTCLCEESRTQSAGRRCRWERLWGHRNFDI